MPGGGFEAFLQVKVHPVSNTNEEDHIIRRALAMCRLCYEEISDNVDQVEEKLKVDIGPHWKEEYAARNAEEPRMDKTNSRVKK